ncbi:cache domain-containing protein [Leifsonia sp. A12D58]|uniref:cache domain-containing protein n=1 Tax=Leifsonia sp. A12D58 TaxID=3397674 RepID=UPI0039E048E2
MTTPETADSTETADGTEHLDGTEHAGRATMARAETTPVEVAAAVDILFEQIFVRLDEWRTVVADSGEQITPGDLDALVEDLVVSELAQPAPLFIGAGFITAGDFVNGTDVHFSWWLGPFEGNPILGRTTEPTKLDLTARIHTEYLRDFRSLEWYSIPETTRHAHVTGPYVDHLCTFEYILTITVPVYANDDRMIGVVGVDVAVRTLETQLLGLFLDCPLSLAMLSDAGRVIMSTDPAVSPGSLLTAHRRLPCPTTPFALAIL